MNAQVLVGVEFALPVENADLTSAMCHNATFTVGKLRGFRDKYFRHSVPLLTIK
jgi:hypothetical protein